MRQSLRKFSVHLTVSLLVFWGSAQAQGLLPIPDISGAAISSHAVLVQGTPFGGEYEYRYTISNPITSTGTIWLVLTS